MWSQQRQRSRGRLMTALRTKAIVAPLVLLLQGATSGCHQADSIQIVNVSLSNTELYQFPTVSGDEDGARIAAQAKHHSISEIRRSAATNFVATYVYQAVPGFVGADEAEMEALTG